MREQLEIVIASRMQNIVHIRKKNIYSVTKLLFRIWEKVLLGLSELRAPTVGPFIVYYQKIVKINHWE